jgi:hypothetical protein
MLWQQWPAAASAAWLVQLGSAGVALQGLAI